MDPNSDPFSKLMDTPPFFEKWYTWAFIGIVAVLAAIRSYLRGPQYFSQTSMKDKVVLITGGNRGIGYFIAKELAIRGAKVYIACRDSALGKAAQSTLRQESRNKEVHYLPIKLGSLDDLKSFAEGFKKKESKLDVLVCNAGVMVCPFTVTTDGFEYHLGVNYIGHFFLVQELFPLLKAAAPSRVVVMSSAAYNLASINYDDINYKTTDYGSGGDCFSQSKLALMLMVNKLSRMYKDDGVTVNSCHPGVVRTDIHRYMPIRSSQFLSISTFPLVWYLMKSPSDGAQTPIHLCVDESVKDITGKYFIDLQEKPVENMAADDGEADKFYLFTKKLISEAKGKKKVTGGQGEGLPEDKVPNKDD